MGYIPAHTKSADISCISSIHLTLTVRKITQFSTLQLLVFYKSNRKLRE